MRIHPGRTLLAAVALVELGALAGAALCSAFLIGWAVLRYGPIGGQPLLGALAWGAVVGGPAGAVALPALGLTILRHTPLGRALGYPLGGALAGLAAAVLLVPGPAAWRVPALVPALGLGGVLIGAAAARLTGSRMAVGDRHRPRQLTKYPQSAAKELRPAIPDEHAAQLVR